MSSILKCVPKVHRKVSLFRSYFLENSGLYVFCFLFFFKLLFIYLTERDTAREGTQAGEVGEGEAGFPLSREPDVGLIPAPWDHDLSRRQTLNWLSHPGAPGLSVFFSTLNFSGKSFTFFLRSKVYIQNVIYHYALWKRVPHFCLFVLQISLVAFLIENCLRIFGEDITSLLGENSMSRANSEKAAGTGNHLIGFSEKQTARLPGVMGDA